MNTHIKQAGYLAFCISLLLLLCGCRVDQVAELERYSRRIKREARPSLNQYVQAYARISDQSNLTALRKLIGQDVLPPLRRAVKALKAIQPSTDELRQIHNALTNTYKTWMNTLETFHKEAVTEAKWVTLAQGLQQAAKQMHLAEGTYQSDIKRYAMYQSQSR